MNFVEIIYLLLLQNSFDMAKTIRGFLENVFEYYFLIIIMNVNFFIDLKFEYYCQYYPEMLMQLSLK